MSPVLRRLSCLAAAIALSSTVDFTSHASAATKVQTVKSTPAATEQKVYWPEVTMILEGALPGNNAKLGKALQLTFGRIETPEGVKWREFVLGYSVLYSKGTRTSINNFRDSEGRITAVSEDAGRVKLTVEMDIADCCYGVKGGKARYVIDAKFEPADGEALDHPDSGTCRLKAKIVGEYKGEMNREDCKVAGPGGKLPCEGKVEGSVPTAAWPSPVLGFVALKPNEHPRLIFRRGELAEIKRRADTPEGRAILECVKKALDGPFSLHHAGGYGILYQVTGDKKYADKAREMVEKAMTTRDRDSRYGFVSNGGKLRAGPSYACVGVAYDLCFDAWEPEFRQKVAKAIQDKVYPDLIYETGSGQHNPHSNHYGAWKGGAGVALLAITGDDGIDQEVVSRSLRHIEGCIRRTIKVGYSEKAYFYEGHYCGRLSSNTGLVQYLQAARVAQGEDWITNSEAAQWLLTKWIYELYRRGPEMRSHMEGMYARAWSRGGWSGGGDFAQGFGILRPDHKAAVKFFYDRELEPGAKTFDVYASGMRGAYALVNWPIGMEERDPADVLGIALWDRTRNRAIIRGGFAGSNDIVCFMQGNVSVRAPGVELSFPGVDCRTEYFSDKPGTRVCVASSKLSAMAFDFSGTCGAPGLLVHVRRPQPQVAPDTLSAEDAAKFLKAMAPKPTAGKLVEVQKAAIAAPKPAKKPSSKDDEPEDPADPTAAGSLGDAQKIVPLKARRADVDFGTITYSVLVLHGDAAPEIKFSGEGNAGKLQIGKRAVKFDGVKIILE